MRCIIELEEKQQIFVLCNVLALMELEIVSIDIYYKEVFVCEKNFNGSSASYLVSRRENVDKWTKVTPVYDNAENTFEYRVTSFAAG